MLARRLTIDACRGGSRRACRSGGVHPSSFSTHQHQSAAALLHGHGTFAAVAAATGGCEAEASAVFDAASVQIRGSKNDIRFSYEPLQLRQILNEVRWMCSTRDSTYAETNKCAYNNAIYRIVQNESLRNNLAYCLSFAEDDSDFTRNLPLLFTDSRMREQLEISRNQLRRSNDASRRIRSGADDAPLPRTVQDALRPSRRAIVITETKAPFRIVDVNMAWEELCGYTFVESKGKTLGSLLKGPETNQLAATSLIAKLLQGEEAGAMLTNYAKDGRMFRNRLRAGPLYDNDDPSTLKYFVGVLQEVQLAHQ